MTWATTWTLRTLGLEISQSEKDKYCMIPLSEVSGVVTFVEMKVDR